MDESMGLTMQDELIADLTAELGTEPTFNADALKQKVINAIKEVKEARGYRKAGYTDEQISNDLLNYRGNIRNIALYDYNKSGAEFEESHSENSTSRSWIKRNSLFSGIIRISPL